MSAAGPMPNNLRIPQQAMSNGVPQAQMQPGLPLNPAVTAELANHAHRVSLQQRQQQMQNMVQQQGNPHPGQTQNSPPRMNGMPPQPGFVPNTLTSYNSNNINGMAGSPGASAPSPAQVGSPRVGLPVPGLPNGGLPPNIPYGEIERNVRRLHPHASPSEIHKLMGESITAFTNNSNNKQHMQQRGLAQPPSGLATSAMNAAAGHSNLGINGQGGQRPPMGIENSSPQMYAQMLSNHHQQRLHNSQQHQQQQQHQQAHGNQNQGQGNGNVAQQNVGEIKR